MELELDVIAICCDFAEYDSFKDWQEDYYGKGKEPEITTVDKLREHTNVISVDDKALIVGGF